MPVLVNTKEEAKGDSKPKRHLYADCPSLKNASPDDVSTVRNTEKLRGETEPCTACFDRESKEAEERRAQKEKEKAEKKAAAEKEAAAAASASDDS